MKSAESRARQAARLLLYGRDWPTFSQRIRFEIAKGRCACTGECGIHPPPYRCVEFHGRPAVFARGRIVLTVAHLCHDAACRDEAHVKAMCQRCHLAYDAPMHRRHASETRDRKAGQARLPL